LALLLTPLRYAFKNPLAAACFKAASSPILLMVRNPDAEIFKLIQQSSSTQKNFFVNKLTLNLRFVFLWECETLLPTIALFPVI
jgi:hypothetical protein